MHGIVVHKIGVVVRTALLRSSAFYGCAGRKGSKQQAAAAAAAAAATAAAAADADAVAGAADVGSYDVLEQRYFEGNCPRQNDYL